MPNIDERIVEMRFDNKNFEKNVQVSMKTLEELKKALDLDKSAQSLANLEKAASNFDLSGIANSISQISDRFSALGIIGVTAMQRIANAAIDAGVSMVKSLSVDQISAGMSKYEMRTKSVQTIMSATGKSIEEVESVLDDLMKYTDETSYDFATMTNTIGKFTSSGVDLKTAERAMEGIANEAAKSGAGIQEANRAMYNFAQALATGSVKLIDWKSIENANMATKEFKEQLIKTGIEMGTLKKGANEYTGAIIKGNKKVAVDYKSFNETLQRGWLTSDVLLKTLEKYADKSTDFGLQAFYAAQKALTFTDALNAVKDSVSSGWMTTFNYLFGNLEEAQDLWTDACNAVIEFTSQISEFRNGILEQWHEMGGYNDMIEAASNIWASFLGVVEMVKDALAEIFPPMTSSVLLDATSRIKDATENLRELVGLKKKKVKVEIETDIDSGTQAIEEWTDFLKTGIYDKATRDALNLKMMAKETVIPTSTKKTYEEVEEWVEEVPKGLTNIERILKGVFAVIDIGAQSLKFVSNIVMHIAKITKPLRDAIILVGAVIGDCLVALDKFIKESGYFDNALERVKTFLKPIETLFSNIGKAITDFLTKGSKITSFASLWKKLIATLSKNKTWKTVIDSVIKFKNSVSNAIVSLKDFYGKAKDFIGSKFESIFASVSENAPKAIAAIKDFVVNSYNSLKSSEKLQNLWNGIKSFFSTFGGAIGDLFSNVWESISSFFTNGGIVNLWNTLKEVWGNIKSFFVDAGTVIVDKITDIYNNSEFLQEVVKKITDSKAYKDLSEFLGLVRDAFVNFFGMDTSDEKTFKDKIQKRLSVFDPIVDWVKEKCESLINSRAFQEISQFFTSIWEAIKNFFSLDTTSIEGTWNKLKARLDAAFDPIIAWFKEKCESLTSSEAFQTIYNFFSSIGEAIKNFFNLDTTEIEGTWNKLKARLDAALGPIITWFKDIGDKLKSAWESLKGTSDDMGGDNGITSISKMIMTSITHFGSDFEGFDIWKVLRPAIVAIGAFGAIKGLSAIVNMFGGIGNIAKNLLSKKGYTFFESGGKKDSIGNTLIKSAASILMIAAGVELVINAISNLKKLLSGDEKETTKEAIKLVREFLLELGAIEVASSIPIGFGKGSFQSAIPAALGIAAGVWILVDAIRKMMALVDKYGIDDNAKTKLTMALNVISKFILDLALIEMTESVIGGNGGKTSLSGPIAITAGVWVLVDAMQKMMALVDKYGIDDDGESKLNKAFDVIINFMLGLGGIQVATSAFGGKGKMSFAGPIAVAASVGMLVESMQKMMALVDKYGINKEGTTKLGLAFGAIEAFMISLGAINTVGSRLSGNAVSSLVSSGGVLAVAEAAKIVMDAMVEALQKIDGIDPSLVSTFAASVDVTIAAFAGIIASLGNLGGKGTAIGEAGLLGLFGVISLGVGMIGGIANSLVESFSSTLNNVGHRIATFSEDIGRIKLDDIQNGRTAVDIIGSIITDIATKYAGKIKKTEGFTNYLTQLSGALAIYSTLTSGYTIEKNDALKSAVTDAIEITEMEFDSDKVKSFESNMSSIGAAMALYKQAVDDAKYAKDSGITITPEMLGDAFTTISDSIPDNKTFHTISSFGKEGQTNGLDNFSSGIIKLANAFALYGSKIGGLDLDKINNANTALGYIVDMKGKLVEIDNWGFMSGLPEEDVLTQFSTDVASLGGALGTYATEIGKLVQDDIINANNVLNTIVGLEIPKTGGLWQLLTGSKSLSKFATNLGDVGEGLGNFADSIVGKDFTNASSATGILETVASIGETMDKSGGMAQWFTGTANFKKLGENLSGYATNLKSFLDIVNAEDFDPDTNAVTKSIGILEQLSTLQSKLNASNSGNTFSAISLDIITMYTQLSGLDDTNAKEIFDNAYLVVDAFVSGINSYPTSISDVFDILLTATLTAIGSREKDFYSAGGYLMYGLAIGLYNNAYMVINAVEDIMGYALYAGCRVVQVASPSKKFMWIGQMMDEGLAIGLQEYSKVVDGAAADVSEGTVDTVINGLKNMNSLIADEIDATPRIVPVLDLSNIASGSSLINGYLGNQNVGVYSSGMANSILSKTANAQNIGVSTDGRILEAFETLNGRVNDLGDRISNMKVVVESGALIGQIENGIDQRLGDRSVYAERGM